MIDRIGLTLVFIFSFLTFLTPELTPLVQVVPLIIFAFLVIARVCFSLSTLRALSSFLEMDGLLFVVVLSALIVGSSVASTFSKSVDYALLFILCLILARLYMTVVPTREVLEAFFWSGIACIILFVPLSFSTLLGSIETLDRFSFLSLKTNLLAFLLVGYSCAMVWKFRAGKWRIRIVTATVILACFVMIFFASSRAALVGGLAGCFYGVAIALLKAKRKRRKQLVLRLSLPTVVLLVAGSLVLGSSWFADASEFADQVLAISEPSRGIDSGFSGRLDSWSSTLRRLSDGSWLTGRGLRSSDSLFPMIDNSYLVILYDLGVIPLILVTWRFLAILWKSTRAYFWAENKPQQEFCLACSILMVVLLVISSSERYLFAVGNPLSLLALLLFATPTSVLDVALDTDMRHFRLSAGAFMAHETHMHRGYER